MTDTTSRFARARNILRNEEGPLRLKLHDAFVYHILSINRCDVPDNYVADFDYIHSMMTATRPESGHDIVSESLMQMADDEVARIAEMISLISAELMQSDKDTA